MIICVAKIDNYSSNAFSSVLTYMLYVNIPQFNVGLNVIYVKY